MNPISVTVTGRLGDDPRTFNTRDGSVGVELRLAIDIPSRIPGGDGLTRWVKVTAFGSLAERTAASRRQGRPGHRPGRRPARRGVGRERVRGAAGAGQPAGPGDRRVDGLRHPAHRLRRPQGRQAPRPRTASPTTCPPVSRPRPRSSPASPPAPDAPRRGGDGRRSPPPPPCISGPSAALPFALEGRPSDEQHRPPAVRISSVAGFLAAIPPLLGFTPRKQPGRGRRSPQPAASRWRSAMTCPTHPTPASRQTSPGTPSASWPASSSRVAVVAGYGPGRLVTPLADAFRAAAPRAGIRLHDVLRVEDGRYWSYLCTDPACCPPEGVAFDPVTASRRGGRWPPSGQRVLASREAVAATIAPVTGADAEAMRTATQQAERAAARLITRKGPQALERPGLTAIRAAIGLYRDGGVSRPGDRVRVAGADADGGCGSATTPGPGWTPPPGRASAAVDRPGPPRPARLPGRPGEPAGVHRLAGRQRRPGQPRPRPRPGRPRPTTRWRCCCATSSTPAPRRRLAVPPMTPEQVADSYAAPATPRASRQPGRRAQLASTPPDGSATRTPAAPLTSLPIPVCGPGPSPGPHTRFCPILTGRTSCHDY